MDATLLVLGFVSGLAVVAAPAITQYMSNRQRRLERAEDKAERLGVAVEVNAVRSTLAQTAAWTNEKLEVIHVLVNSQMTAAMRSEVESTTRELVSLREIIDLKQTAGRPPTPEAIAHVKATEVRLAEMNSKLADRMHDQADAQALAQARLKENEGTTGDTGPTGPTGPEKG